MRRVLKDPASVLYGSTLLVEVSESVAQLAVQLGAMHNLRATDAVHLATAAWVGADAFVTNNLNYFKPAEIEEVTVLSPADL